MMDFLGANSEQSDEHPDREYPKVHHRRSGVRYVKADDLLRSEAAQRELDRADEALDALAAESDEDD